MKSEGKGESIIIRALNSHSDYEGKHTNRSFVGYCLGVPDKRVSRPKSSFIHTIRMRAHCFNSWYTLSNNWPERNQILGLKRESGGLAMPSINLQVSGSC